MLLNCGMGADWATSWPLAMGMSLVINEGVIYDKEVVTASVTSSHYMPALARHTLIAAANIIDFNVFTA